MEISDTARRLHADSLVIDAHVHPSLKTYLFKKKLWKSHRSGGAFNPFTMRVDLPKTCLLYTSDAADEYQRV